jgi:BASS family bile acid:Na+ symporter
MSAFVRLFWLWVTLGSALALIWPPAFTWVLTYGLVTPGLQIIMLGMGLTLTLDDFRRVAKQPQPVLLGVLLQYTVMPLLGFSAGQLGVLDAGLAAGLVLVCCCPGGTASNVIAYLSRADVALSVSMTATSTLLAAVMTPSLTWLLVGNRVAVDTLGLFVSAAKVVLVPVALCVLLNQLWPKLTARLLPFAPPAAVIAIVLIVGAILGAQRQQVLASGFSLLGTVFLVHALGFAVGGLIGGRLRTPTAGRTIAIEVGMQNSGLGVVLARANFKNPSVAIPPAVSSIVHCVIGSAVAAYWARDKRSTPSQDVG